MLPRQLISANAAACASPVMSPSQLVPRGPMSAHAAALTATRSARAADWCPPAASGPSAAMQSAASPSGSAPCLPAAGVGWSGGGGAMWAGERRLRVVGARQRVSRFARLCAALSDSDSAEAAYGICGRKRENVKKDKRGGQPQRASVRARRGCL